MTKATSFRTAVSRNRALKLAESIGVKEAARELGLHRNTLNNWKRRKKERGTQGLKPITRKQTPHPQTTPAATVEAILQLALAHPSFGCYRLRDLLPSDDCRVSTTTIQNILNRNGLGTKKDRQLALERRGSLDELSEEQTEFVSRKNPCFPKCNVRNQGPGWALVAGSWRIRTGDSQRDMLLFTVLDAWTGYVFGAVTTDERKDHALQKLSLRVSGFYEGWGCNVHSVYLFSGMGHSDNAFLSYENNDFLLKAQLSQNVVSRGHPSCCLKRFQDIVTREFFKPLDRDTFRSDADEFDQKFHEWLRYYNAERRNEGYPHNGRTPLHRFNLRPKVRSVRKASARRAHEPDLPGGSGASISAKLPSYEKAYVQGRKTRNLLDFVLNDTPDLTIQLSDFRPPPFDFLWYYCNRSRIGPARKLLS